MNALIKEEQKMDHLTKTYLQLYTDYISGYKQYKLEKGAMQHEVPSINNGENNSSMEFFQ